MTPAELNKELGNIDLFLLDQILKGRFNPKMKILDVGCGEGRNLVYFLQNGYNIFALDQDPIALKMARMHARTIRADISADQFIKTDVGAIPFPADIFDVLLSISVLHFAKNRKQFRNWIKEMVRVMKNSSLLLISTNTLFGIENKIKISEGVYQLEDGSKRYLVDQDDLDWFANLGLKPLEPVRWEVINGERSQLNLIMQKEK